MPEVSLANLGQALRDRRGARGLREVAEQVGVTAATLSRVESGKCPDIHTFKKICVWMGLDAGEVLGTPKSEPIPSESLPVVHYRAEQNLTPEAAKGLAQMILAATKLLRA